jgi:hypothetical protein
VQAILEAFQSQEIVMHGLFPGLAEVATRYEQQAHLYPDMYEASPIFPAVPAKIKPQIISMETGQNM